jgi:transposase
MSRSKGQPLLPIEDKVRIVLAVLAGEVSLAEAARRHGVSAQAVANWRDRFVESGRAGLEHQLPCGAGQARSRTEWWRANAEQLKRAPGRPRSSPRVWQKGAGYLEASAPSSARAPAPIAVVSDNRASFPGEVFAQASLVTTRGRATYVGGQIE